ncbi:hypothetical protein Q1695_011030 [Nippostrongylus brasiliensis]|nr:hypothetical protein Q1695_011030 [Nippostrongylus brasiliensis]
MQDVFAVCELYRAELNEAVFGLQNHGILSERSAQRRQNPVNEQSRKAEAQIRKKFGGPVNMVVLEVFIWTSIMLLFSAFAMWLGSLIPIAQDNMSQGAAIILAYVIIPSLTVSRLNTSIRGYVSDVALRFTLLASAVAQSLTLGAIFDKDRHEIEPIPFLTPLVYAIAYPLILRFENREPPLLVGCTTVALIANYFAGLALGDITTSYELMAIAYVAANAGTMQMIFKTSMKSKTGHKYQYILHQSMILIRSLWCLFV